MPRLGLTLQQVADLVGQARIVGDASFVCESVAPLETAAGNDLSFARDGTKEKAARESAAGALVVGRELEGIATHQLVVADVMEAMILVLERIGREKRSQPPGVDSRAVVDNDAVLGEGVVVGPGAVISRGVTIGDRAVIYANAFVGFRSRVGEDSVVHPNVTIMEDVSIGDRVIIHSGTVIGCDGYGFVPHRGKQIKVPQVGEVVIADDVEIGACSTIDRATVDRTEIGRGTKIGDLVHIAHNVIVGEDVLILPQVGIAGSTRIGSRAVLAGRSACSGHLTIGEGAILGAAAVAYKDVEPGAVLWGNPAREKTTEMRVQSALSKLPEMARELRRLRRAISDKD